MAIENEVDEMKSVDVINWVGRNWLWLTIVGLLLYILWLFN